MEKDNSCKKVGSCTVKVFIIEEVDNGEECLLEVEIILTDEKCLHGAVRKKFGSLDEKGSSNIKLSKILNRNLKQRHLC
jgi:hypothetical protein